MKKEPKTSKRKRLIVLDSHAILHRAYHALPDFSTSSGEPTGALYGLVTMLLKVIDELKPDFIVATRDLPGGTHRHKVYEAYKATRVEADPALIMQLERAPEIFKAFGIPLYEAPGFEADDVIGTIVNEMKKHKDVETIIASGDLDTLQLVSKKDVLVYTLRQGLSDTILYDEDRVRERYGFEPELIPDYKGLRGDPSDNIRGIAGIGEKTASLLVSEFGSIEDMYETLKKYPEEFEKAGVKKRVVELLRSGEKDARFSKELATIHNGAPIAFSLPDAPWRLADNLQAIDTVCDTYEFRSIKERLHARMKKEARESGVEIPDTDVASPEDIAETAIALWLVRSDITNPSYDDILNFANTSDFNRAKTFIMKKLRETGRLEELFDRIEKPLMPVVARMNQTGVCIDARVLRALTEEYRKEIGLIEARIYSRAGHEFNINSTKQLGVVLYDELKITNGKLKKTATGARTTREEELAKMRELHPIINDILAYRELAKLLSTYVEKMVELVDANGRLHAEFLQAGTTTGRMASQNPNLQNIPIRTEYGRRIRDAFTAPKGFLLAGIDYSQIELRVAAGLSGDEKLLDVFKTSGDIHTAVAAEVFGVAPEKVDKEMRRKAKVINFGILYGMGVNALRASLGEGVTRDEAALFLENYFAQFPQLTKWIEKTKRDAARNGFTETVFGRRRYFAGFNSALPQMRAQAERMAINAPIQGTQADIIKLAMVQADAMLESRGWRDNVRLVMQIHDELVYEVSEDIAEEAAREIKRVMESVAPQKELSGVPIIAEAALGEHWGAMKRL